MNEDVRFEGGRVARVREDAENARWEQLSEDIPDGWSKSIADAAVLLQAFPPLTLKDGFVLRAYQYREGRDGNGVIWAMPQDIAFPEPEECEEYELPWHAWTLETVPDLIPPRPDGALDDIMQVVQGDGTPWSYLCASLLAREAAEFGAFGHGSFWSAFHILSGDPSKGRDDASEHSLGQALPSGEADDWQWLATPPKHWLPRVRMDDQAVEVNFYTFCGLGGQMISHHKDSYTVGAYHFEADDRVIASGPAGYVW